MSMRIKAALVIMAIVFVFTTASFLLSMTFTRQYMTDVIQQELELSLDIADTVVSTKISLLKSNAETMSERLNAASNDDLPSVMEAQMIEFTDFIALTVYDRSGIVANYGIPLNHNVFLLENDYIQVAHGGDSFLTSVHYNGMTGDLVMHVFVPLGTDKVLSATIPGLFFSEILSDYRLWDTGSIFIVDDAGTFVASYRLEFVLDQRNFIDDANTDPDMESAGRFHSVIISNDSGSGNYALEGIDRFCVFKLVTGSGVGWRIGVTAPLSESPLRNVQDRLLMSALFFLIAGAIVSVLVSGVAINPFKTIQAQAAQIKKEHENTSKILDIMPFSAILWSEDIKLFRCNEETLRVYDIDDKQYFLDNFFEFSPEYQPDGQLSRIAAENNIRKAFADGKYVFEWMHQKRDGTQIPVEATLVRVTYGGANTVAAYVRDLREYKRMMQEIERNTGMLNTMNQVANILLQPESDDFREKLQQCMSMIGKAVDADRVSVWKNNSIDGKLFCSQISEWVSDPLYRTSDEVSTKVSYAANIPTWETLLAQGKCINSLITDLPAVEQKRMATHGILAVFTAPVFIYDEFWGFVGFDNCHNETIFTEDEASILTTGSLFIANALVRNKMMSSIKEASVKLESALDQATSANEAKSNFLANMSHEMRTPLNAIIGLTDLTLGNETLDNESYTNLEKISNAGMVLLSTVNDILDTSKIEAGKFELVHTAYDIPSLINDAVTQSNMHKDEKPIELILDIDGDLPTQLFGDELRIKQIFNNLLSNAFKYTKEGTIELSVHCARDGDTVWMTVFVRDTGIGISPEYIDSVFDDYSQMDTKTNRDVMGTGIGLSITRKLVELMNGTIKVESEYGKGSIFTVRLPQAYVSDSVIGQEMVENLKNFNYYEHKRIQNAKLSYIRMPYARVLVVDDVATNLDVAKGLMKPYELQVDCVTSGMEAIEAMRDESVRYNAVFIDHMMPGMDGIETSQHIREIGTDYAKSIPLIALTANAIAGNEKMFLDKGFQAFVSKPIEINRLDTVMREWVRDKDQETMYFDRHVEVNGKMIPDSRSGRDRRASPARRRGFDRRELAELSHGLDIDRGLARFGGDEDVYLGILRSFAVNTKPLLEKVRNVSRDDLSGYSITVHGIKGSSRSIFAGETGDRADALEKAAKSGDFDFILGHNQSFIEIAETLIANIERIIGRMEKDSWKPQKDVPDKETLQALLEACKDYNMDGADEAIAQLEMYEYESDDGLVAWLRENINEANFAEIVEKLR